MPGITDVARRAGVSKATASRALSGSAQVSDETRRRVREVAAEIGYVPSTSAVSLATGRSRAVGVVIPYLTRWFFAEVLEGIQEVLLAEGLDLTLYDARPGTPGRSRVFDDFLARQRFDGLIAVGLEPDDHELERLVSIGRPVVSVVGGGHGSSTVAVDDLDAARRATEHLLALGHTDIAFLGGAADGHGPSVDLTRLRGYGDTMLAAGLEPRHSPGPTSLPGGYAAAVDVLGDRRRRPTAIVGVCDEVAIGAMIAARRLGIPVPSGLSVVGIDDHEYAEMFALTTLAQAPREQGAAAARLLCAELADPGLPPVEQRVQARLVVRSSTAPVAGHDGVIVSDTGLARD